MLYDRMKPRVKAVMDFGISILCIALFAIVVKQSLVFALRMAGTSQVTPVLHIPLYPFIYISTIGIVVLILGFILDLLKSIRDFKGDRLDV
jgi:TRAP-type C4-dicarboxylate transport system permease small subunit